MADAIRSTLTRRGSGACDWMLRHVLRELFDDGVPLASLYASAQRLYRSVGFEQAGSQWQYSMPISSFGAEQRETPLQRHASPPLEPLNLVAAHRARHSNGHLSRTDGLWQRLLAPYDTQQTTTYVIGDAQCPEGFAILKPGSRDEAVPQALVATDVAANTPAALSRLVTLIHDHRSMNNRFKWYGGPNDSLVMMAREQHVSVEEHHRWMLRIIDLRSALQGRGYRSCCAGELHFDIKDDLLPENSGRWILRVADGRGSAQRGGQGHLQMHVRSLAPLFSAYYSPSQLAQMGLLAAADSQQLALADAVFAGPSPWVSELF